VSGPQTASNDARPDSWRSIRSYFGSSTLGLETGRSSILDRFVRKAVHFFSCENAVMQGAEYGSAAFRFEVEREVRFSSGRSGIGWYLR
jgi:hypothetical protein